MLALRGGTVAGVELVPDRFDGKAFPVGRGRTRPRGRLEGRLFNHFIWGGYMLYAWPEQRVFIDGGTDYYGEEVFNEYLRVWNLDPGWDEVLREAGHLTDAHAAAVPPRPRAGPGPQWTVWYCDSTAAILRRPTASKGSATTSPADSALLRCGAAPTGPQ